MTGKVFISCGMHLKRERNAVGAIQGLLKTKFKLNPYVAIAVQSLDDIMNITKELRSSDYYLFIDFKRLSLFSHQELALAHNLGFGGNIIVLRQKGTQLKGFLRYVQGNPEAFNTMKELLEKVETLVRQKGWSSDYSRNLIIDPILKRSSVLTYGDHTGQTLHESWSVKIENRRSDVAAVGVVCILDSILLPSGTRQPSPDRGYLKWAGHRDYERTILPKSTEEVALFATRVHEPGVFLLSTLDVVPRQPILIPNGKYELNYKVFAQDFQMIEFTVALDLKWQAASPPVWGNQTNAQLKAR